METEIKITGMEELKADLSDAVLDKFPITMARALTMTAQNIQTAEVEEMKKVFDRPTPWALGGTYVQEATKDYLMASVKLKDEFSSGSAGIPASAFLLAEIFPGQRNMKRFERALNYYHVLPDGMYIVPGAGAQIDAYGGMKASQITQILSYFQAHRTANTTEERKKKMRGGVGKTAGIEYFVIRAYTGDAQTRHLKPGIYARTFVGYRSKLTPIMMFVRRPTYRQRLDWFGIGNAVAEAMLPINFALQLQETIARLNAGR